MNTKLIMTASALFLGIIGITLTFFPLEMANLSGISAVKTFQLLLQLLGALYFSFAMLNWMAKGAIIGGIYNKPIALVNFTHFFIGALALIKALTANNALPAGAWGLGLLYLAFAVVFGLLIFGNPPAKSGEF
jgi:hypothetical protein